MGCAIGKDLLLACEESLINSFQGRSGMMCIWYVTPCDCQNDKDIIIPRVCLPEKVSHEVLAKEVVEGLKLQVELQSQSAEMAAGLILSPKYPCD